MRELECLLESGGARGVEADGGECLADEGAGGAAAGTAGQASFVTG
jgi:hypothetical protein